VRIYEGEITLWEHTFFASREIGILYETEPVIGNYALAYALGLARAPYQWAGPPRYREDLAPLNEVGLYVTPATFDPARLRFALTLFNAQSDSYFSAFTNNAIVAPPTGWVARAEGTRWFLINPQTGERRQVRPNNFPQSGRIRMLGLGSVAHCYLLADESWGALDALDRWGVRPAGVQYVRLGKFNSKAAIAWREVEAVAVEGTDEEVTLLLNAADLPPGSTVVPLAVYNIHPVPLLERTLVSGRFWRLPGGRLLPVGLRFGVEGP
jgi:CRISPR-associated protein Csc1